MRIGGLHLALLAAFGTIAAATSVRSQEWPQRLVKIVVPYAPGDAAAA